jgi:DnaK suppressor protein
MEIHKVGLRRRSSVHLSERRAVRDQPALGEEGTAMIESTRAAAAPQIAQRSRVANRHLAHLGQQLEEQRRFRLEQIERLSAEAAMLARAGDEARWQINRALTMAAHWALGDINAALRRLDHDSYGICERCSQPISLERLEILPMSRLCMPCQRREDGGKAA